MKKNIVLSLIIALGALFMFSNTVDASVWVDGYFRSDGTHVQGHYRSSPDGNPYTNWSFPGNTNPYTRETATGNPSTYLNNYYNTSSTYNTPSLNFNSSYSTPNYNTPSINWGRGYGTSTYNTPSFNFSW